MASTEPTAHRFKITLLGFRPPIWRRVLVPSHARLGDLHVVIQRLFGWDNSHLHEFVVDGDRYADSFVESDWGEPVLDEDATDLATVAPKGAKLTYVYDFGDWWEHSVRVEDIVAIEPGTRQATCLTAKRAAPPDDIGGTWGYLNALEAIIDPEHERHEEMVDWLGSDFDPGYVDLDAVNRALAKVSL